MLLAPWVRDGRLPPLLPAIGVAVMLVNLLAAGGIGQPGVAGVFWLLLALALDGQGPRVLPRPAASPCWPAAIALAAACFLSGYRPVLRSQTRLRAAEIALFEGRQTDAQQDLDAAAQADPLAAEPWRQLAGLTFQQWQRQPSEEAFRRFATCMAHALERAPGQPRFGWPPAIDISRPSPTAACRRSRAGDRCLSPGGRILSQQRLVPRQARAGPAKNRPAGGIRREAATALRLDNLNPHEENKLEQIAPGRPQAATSGS